MKVQFYISAIDSDVYEVPDDITDDELNDMACEWVTDNVRGDYVIVDEDE